MTAAQTHGNHLHAGEDDSLLAEKRSGWTQFCQFTTYGVVGVTALLILMRLFLVSY